MNYACQVKQVRDKIAFDFLVKRWVAVQTWTQIYFQQPRFELIIYQHIKAKQLKAVIVVRHKHLSGVIDYILPSYDRLENYIFDLLENGVMIYA